MEWLSIILGIVGAFTGSTSLLFTWAKYREERAKISIGLSLIESYSNAYFFHKAAFEDNFQSKPYRVCIQTDIFNDSSRPVTIHEIQLDIKNLGKFYLTEYIHALYSYSFNISPTQTIDLPIGKYQIKLPLEMTPFLMKRGYLFFPIKKDMSLENYSAVITVLSSRGKFYSNPILISPLDLDAKAQQIMGE